MPQQVETNKWKHGLLRFARNDGEQAARYALHACRFQESQRIIGETAGENRP
jgi:hypothetical protein